MSFSLNKIILNKYLIILLGFIIWMYFFDDNSIKIHQELNKDINKYETSIDFYKTEIEKDKKLMEDYQDSVKIEKFARETYQMKKDNENIYIIQYDSIDK